MVSLSCYPCFCKENDCLEQFNSKNDEQYIRCKERKCGFFSKAENFNEYLDNFTEKVKSHFKHDHPLCDHRKPATLWISRSENNPGRGFFKCSQRDDRCKYFQWCDEQPSKNTIANWQPEVKTIEKAVQAEEYQVIKRKLTDTKKTEKKKRKVSPLNTE